MGCGRVMIAAYLYMVVGYVLLSFAFFCAVTEVIKGVHKSAFSFLFPLCIGIAGFAIGLVGVLRILGRL